MRRCSDGERDRGSETLSSGGMNVLRALTDQNSYTNFGPRRADARRKRDPRLSVAR